MQTAARGNATEAAVLSALIERGLDVLIPFGAGHPYDLVVDAGVGVFVRVQCKTARNRGACIDFNSRTTDHGRGRMPYTERADLFGIYWPLGGLVYLVPVSEATMYVCRLRLAPAINRQQRGVRYASGFELDRWTVERLRSVVKRPTDLAAAA